MEENWYDRNYKKLLILPVILILFAIIYLGVFTYQTGDVILKDVSITGGTTIKVFDSGKTTQDVKNALEPKFPDILVRGVSDIRTGKQIAFLVETSADVKEIRSALEEFLGYKLDSENSSTQFTGSSISEGFYKQLRVALFIAFIFMALVVFLIFRTPIPSLAVIISAFADITLTIAAVDFFGVSLSTGGIVALLMLVGYSVDTDILLTTRVLRKRGETLNKRMFDAFKTGMTMTLTSIIAIAIALIIIYTFSEVLRQMFLILLIGLSFDLFNTWITNASILKWYAESKKIK